PEQRAIVAKHHAIAARLAAYYTKKSPPGLIDTDLLSAAEEALAIAVASPSAPSGEALENYLWVRVRGAMKDLIRSTAKELGRSAEPADAPTARLLRRASAALDDYALAFEDPGNVFDDTHEASVAHLVETVDDGASALAVGGSGGVWHMRGEE